MGGAAAGAGGSGGGGVTAGGVAKITIPFTSGNGSGAFGFELPTATNFTTGVVTYRVYVQIAGAAANLQAFVQTGGSCYTPQFAGFNAVSGFTSGFANVTFDVGNATPSSSACAGTGPSTAFDKTNVLTLGLQVIGSGAGTATVWLDSVTVTATTASVGPFNFDSAASVGTGQGLHSVNFGGLTTTIDWQAAYP